MLLIWVSLAGTQFAWAVRRPPRWSAAPLAAGLAAVVVELRVAGAGGAAGLFRNRTVVLADLAGIVVGVRCSAASVFLGQYFQVARGYSADRGGPADPAAGGRADDRLDGVGSADQPVRPVEGLPGRRGDPTTTGLSLLSTMDHTTSIPLLGVYLAVLGVGGRPVHAEPGPGRAEHGDATEVGAASSLVAFLRSMGGTIGVTVLGIVLSHRVSALLGVPASGASSGTSDLSQLDAAAATAVRAAYGDAIGRVFLIAAIGSILTLVAVAFIKEVPLRTTVGREPEPAAVPEPPAPISAPVLPPAGDGRPRHAAPADSEALDGDGLFAPSTHRSQDALAALDDVERAARDLADARGRLASSVDRLRAAGFAQQQIDGLLARRVADGAQA